MMTRSTQRCLLALAVVLSGYAGVRSAPVSTPARTTPPVPAAPPAATPPTTPKPPKAACALGTELPETLLAPASILLFGEIHGVQELPTFFGEAVCSAADTRLPIEVGLEIPKAEQARIDSFLASAGAPADVQTLVAGEFWTRDTQDGRSSQAMVALLERFRQLRAQGLSIHVFLFDLNSSQSGGERDKGMADNLSSHARAHPEALTMALTGEVHSWKTKGAPWDPEFLPMGWYLEKGGVQVHSLGRATPAGTAWICMGTSPSDCGPKETKANIDLPDGALAGIALFPARSKRGYDGVYVTSSLTASPPAQPAHEVKR